MADNYFDIKQKMEDLISCSPSKIENYSFEEAFGYTIVNLNEDKDYLNYSLAKKLKDVIKYLKDLELLIFKAEMYFEHSDPMYDSFGPDVTLDFDEYDFSEEDGPGYLFDDLKKSLLEINYEQDDILITLNSRVPFDIIAPVNEGQQTGKLKKKNTPVYELNGYSRKQFIIYTNKKELGELYFNDDDLEISIEELDDPTKVEINLTSDLFFNFKNPLEKTRVFEITYNW